MIREIKKKLTKYGSVIAFAQNEVQVQELIKHNAVAAYAIVHHLGGSNDKGYGQLVVGHKNVPKFKNVVGHYISQIRGGELVVFLRPDAALLGDATGIYNHLDSNRIERAYALFLGSSDAPTAIVLSSTLMEHLFHAIPDGLDMNGDWIGFVDRWLKKSLFGGRYFDGNILASLAVKEVKPASEYKIEAEPIAQVLQEATEATAKQKESGIPVTAKSVDEAIHTAARRPGRPKTKK